MEPKTIGAFITALRKAKGMTQKELAEMLDVSDKTVSRWERDEGMPDLSLIPVIAEIFKITCDELLRGERKPAAERETQSPKGKKQWQRIIASGMNRFQNRSYIAIGISLVGLIAAMIGNLCFQRAYIGFFIGCVFYLVSILLQIIFANQALLCIGNEEFQESDVGQFKERVIKLAKYSIGVAVFLFAFSLPLTDNSIGIYRGLMMSTWLRRSIVYLLVALAIWYLVCQFIYAALIKKGTIQLTEQQAAVRSKNRQVKRRCALWLLAAMTITLVAQILFNTVVPVSIFAEPTRVFEDYESFEVFMERDIPLKPKQLNSLKNILNSILGRLGGTVASDHWDTETLIDGSGNIVCQYLRKNLSVVHIDYAGTIDDFLPISVYTTGNLQVYHEKMEIINRCFLAVYLLEAVAAFLVYSKKHTK